ncbi:MAG: hypothetical protein DRH30_07080 [Deltaproteobacteria bacterium]|nr:MAG: hypothetical protein DRH30_07080 [Deltaproteobacteria bacterium]
MLRGGLEDQGFFTSEPGGGVTNADGGAAVVITRPDATDGFACDESRLGRSTHGGVRWGTLVKDGGVTRGGVDE